MALRDCEVVSQILSLSPSIPPRSVPLITRSLRPPLLNSDSFYATRIDARLSGNEEYQGMLLSPPEILNTDSDTALGPIRPLSGRPRPHEGWKWSSEVEAGNSAAAMVVLSRQVD